MASTYKYKEHPWSSDEHTLVHMSADERDSLPANVDERYNGKPLTSQVRESVEHTRPKKQQRRSRSEYSPDMEWWH